ncbi:hypothetical protein [Streptomyces sp. NBC_00474]|uniref:hypothetical protein n=1 Tax=Streptomyces sp. NBC_00474 TaxID=2975754 RepID=UPI002258488D|nr:hypothetical protein [Streptomyces sp. NBC_00474]MCX5049390.1 hypothetical protein [Streptomyces sp. NBC_00474]
MCTRCDDFARTVVMLGKLALYASTLGADEEFIEVAGPSLAASLPDPPPGVFPPGYNPDAGPRYPGGSS